LPRESWGPSPLRLILFLGALALAVVTALWLLRGWPSRTLQIEVHSPICGSWHIPGSDDTGIDFVTTHFNTLSAASPDDVWFGGATLGKKFMPAFAHWDGKNLRSIPALEIGADEARVLGLDATAIGVWAVGYQRVGTRYSPLALTWDGKAWVNVPIPHTLTDQSGREVTTV
jgi:hypothetical protein